VQVSRGFFQQRGEGAFFDVVDAFAGAFGKRGRTLFGSV